MDLPVATSFRCQDYFEHRHGNHVGNLRVGIDPALSTHIAEAHLIVALGPRLGEMTTQGYTLVTPPVTKQKLIYLHAGAEELGRVFAGALLINSGLPGFLEQAAALEPIAPAPWPDLVGGMWEAKLSSGADAAAPARPGRYGHPYTGIGASGARRSIICNGAGNYTGWIYKYWRFNTYRSQLAPLGNHGVWASAPSRPNLPAPSA